MATEGAVGPDPDMWMWVPYGVDHAVDQVTRKLEFIERHPEWTIVFVRSMGYYEAARDDPNTVITSYDLKELLDKVKAATPGDDDRDAG